MNLIDAIKSGKPFRRGEQGWTVPPHAFGFSLTKDDILSADWELKPEEPRKAREFWVKRHPQCSAWTVSDMKLSALGEIHVREVLPGSVQVTRAIIEKAFNEAWFGFTDMSAIRLNLCRALGLSEGE